MPEDKKKQTEDVLDPKEKAAESPDLGLDAETPKAEKPKAEKSKGAKKPKDEEEPEFQLRGEGIFLGDEKVAYFSDPKNHLRFEKGMTHLKERVDEFLETLPIGANVSDREEVADKGVIPDKPKGAPHLGQQDPRVKEWVAKYGNR